MGKGVVGAQNMVASFLPDLQPQLGPGLDCPGSDPEMGVGVGSASGVQGRD